MKPRTQVALLVHALVVMVAFAGAVMAAATYYDPANGIRYTTPLTVNTIISRMPPNAGAIRDALRYEEWTLAVCVLVGVVVLLITRHHPRSLLRGATAVAQFVILYWAWAGFLLLPVLMWNGLDGEALAEHLLTYIVGSMWLLWIIAILAVSWDISWRRGSVPLGS